MAAPNSTTTSNKRTSPSLPDGVVMGQSATDLVGFYGATPIAQPTAAAQAAITDSSGGTAHSDTGIQALSGTYNSTLIANAISTLAAAVNAHRTVLVNLGLEKGS